MNKQDHEQILIKAGLSAEPFTALEQIKSGQYGKPSNDILKAISFLTRLVLFEEFGYVESE